MSRPAPVRMRKGAAKISSHLIESIPLTMTKMLIAQKMRKQKNSPPEMPMTGKAVFSEGSNPKMIAAIA